MRCPNRTSAAAVFVFTPDGLSNTMEAVERRERGTGIAKQQLRYSDPDECSRCGEVRLGSPVESPGGGERYCSWQILVTGGEQVRAAYGIDAFQSLQLVMKMIGATLDALSKSGKRLSWIDSLSGDISAFPPSRASPRAPFPLSPYIVHQRHACCETHLCNGELSRWTVYRKRHRPNQLRPPAF